MPSEQVAREKSIVSFDWNIETNPVVSSEAEGFLAVKHSPTKYRVLDCLPRRPLQRTILLLLRQSRCTGA